MNLGGKSLMVNPRKTLVLVLAIALVAASLGALFATPARVAQAQGTITLSSENFHPYKVIEIRVDIPGLIADTITLRVLDPTGQPVGLKNCVGEQINNGTFVAAKVATGVYYAYLGGNNTEVDKIPKYPKMSREAHKNAFVNITQSLDPTVLTIEVLGFGITKTVNYNVVASSITLDRTSIPIRRSSEFKVTITLNDQDLNFDPTAVDLYTGSNTTFVALWITHISSITGASKPKGPIDLSSLTIKESAANSGTFTITFTVSNIKTWLDNIQLEKDDTLIFKVASNITADSGTTFGGDKDLFDTKVAKAVYAYPTISIDFTQQKLKIMITSPDDNVNPGVEDGLDPDTSISAKITYDKDYDIKTLFKETGKNTGVFACEFSVVWNTTAQIDVTNKRIGLTPNKASFSVTVEYLNITAKASYVTVKPVVEVVKATPKLVQFKVTDRDLNTGPKSVEYLSPYVTTGKICLNAATPYGEWVTLYEIVIKDSKGNLVNIPATYSPSFFETDLDSGVFNLMLPSGIFKAGETYIIDIIDYTGEKTTVTQTVTVMPIKIELDRTVYPVNATTNVVVYVTYYNDTANVDPTRVETLTDRLKYNVTDVEGKPIWSAYAQPITPLTETGPDTGVFKGKIELEVNTPRWIDAKLVVYEPGTDVKVEATFKPYGLTATDLKVSPLEVNMTGDFKITLYDPDSNVDSASRQEVYVTVKGSKGTRTAPLTETDVNTGVFEGVFKDIAAVAKPGDKIVVEYWEKTPVLAPTATSFEGSEYKITATVKVVSFSGYLDLPKDWIGPYETMTITVVDPDLNVDTTKAESASVSVTIEGVARTITVQLTETGVNTGVFKGKLDLPKELTGTSTPEAKMLRDYIGKKVTIVYLDEADATGARATAIKTLTIRAVDAEIMVDKTAVNLGEALTITIKNADIAQNPAAEFRRVLVRSTTYPTGVTLYALEVEPGVYSVTVKAVSLADWTIGAPEIPAKLGDTITIEYTDPIAADGTEKSFTKTVVVGVPVERPVPASEQKFLDVTGAEKKVGKVGETVMLSAKVQNVDVVDREFTAIFQVKDERGAVVYIAWVTAKLAPGTSMTPAVSWTPTVAGTYTVEVLVVKSIAEPTPYSDKISAPFTVQ
jgi:hypothetical protein